MKKLLMALLLTFVLAFTYSCSDTAGNPSSGGPDTGEPDTGEPEIPVEPEPENPDDEVVETGKEWGNIKFLDDVQLPEPDGITVVDKFVVSTAQGTETVTQTEAIINEYTYDQFKTYVNSLKAIGVLYENKTHSKIEHILGGGIALLPDTLEDDNSTYFVFDYDTHYTTITYYGDTYTGEREATDTHNLSIKLTKIDPFSNIGGKVKVMKDVRWTDIKFMLDPSLTPPIETIDFVTYDNATDNQEITLRTRSLTVKKHTDYLEKSVFDNEKFTRHRAIPKSAEKGMTGVFGVAGLKDHNSGTWVVTDTHKQYISLTYIGSDSPAYSTEKVNFKITVSKTDPFEKGESSKDGNLTATDTITKLPPITPFQAPDFITALGATGKVVTFNDTKYGKEIRFAVDDTDANYDSFRTYLGKAVRCIDLFGNRVCKDPESGITVDAFTKNQSHPKSMAGGLGTGIDMAVPGSRNDSLTAAWSFVDGVDADGVTQYTSFIWHGSKSPNNPNKNSKAIFIIERMSFDPMWFLP